jgi:hypothetical protein
MSHTVNAGSQFASYPTGHLTHSLAGHELPSVNK